MTLIIVAALNRRRVIGKGGKLPWHISEDLKHFKRITTGHTVLMGRKTYESLGKPLSHRRNVVLTSRDLPGVETFPTMESALEALKKDEKVFVIGGGAVFGQLLEKSDEWFLTIVKKDVDGDTFFPPYEHLIGNRFLLVEKEDHQGFSFLHYRKVE